MLTGYLGRESNHFTPEAAERVLEIDMVWFAGRIEVGSEPELEKERLLAKVKRLTRFDSEGRP